MVDRIFRRISAAAWTQAWPCALVALGVSFFFHWLQFDAQLDWCDEGFLWYGVRQTMAGQVPLRDFQSYDPLRYYWGALFTPVFGGGLFGLRHAVWLFQVVALFFGLMALRRATKDLQALVLSTLVLVLWQFWHFRFFDAGWPIVAVFLATRLLERPNRNEQLAAGIFTGLSVFLGVNHGLYLFCVFIALMLYAEAKGPKGSRSLPWPFFGGLLAGLLPLIVMLLFVPGFGEKYLERVAWYAQNLSRGQTDIRLDIPWPWHVRWELVTQNPKGWVVGLLHYSNVLGQGLAFITLILMYLAGAWMVATVKDVPKNALFIASYFVGLFYLNHVFARSDITHLGEMMFPLWAMAAACAPWLRAHGARALRAWLLILTVVTAVPLTVLFLKAMVAPQAMTLFAVGRDQVWLFKRDAQAFGRMKEIVAKHVPKDEPVFLAPLMPTLYPLLDRVSPTHQIYFLREEPAPIQRRVIEELEANKVDWAVIGDVAIDGRPEQTFSVTHPILADYLYERFEPVHEEGLPAGHLLLRRKAV